MVEGAAAAITVLATKYSKFQTGQVNFKDRVFNTHRDDNITKVAGRREPRRYLYQYVYEDMPRFCDVLLVVCYF